ncbi:hypothetical protein Pondi_00055 [Escherichia phage Pondi]|nr:hypothetical protein Pondi_00055 [Escherichia phage Pondi]
MFSVAIILSSFACLMFSVVAYILAETFESVSWRERTLGAISGSFIGILTGLGVAAIQVLIHLAS